MVKTASTMAPIGMEAPDFALPDTEGRRVARDDFAKASGLLVVFLSNHCPFVKHVRAELANFVREYQEKGLAVVGINSNDIETHPDDSPAMMVLEVEQVGYTFPYLFDEDQSVAKAYAAACTPDFFLFDGERRLAYRGQFDDSPAQQRTAGGRTRLAGGGRCTSGGQARRGRTGAERRLQHQVEAGERARLLRLTCAPGPRPGKSGQRETRRRVRCSQRRVFVCRNPARWPLMAQTGEADSAPTDRSGDRLPLPGWTGYMD